MRLLTTLHRWTGGLVGLLLAVLALSGTALVWEEQWMGLPGTGDPLAVRPDAIAAAIAVAAEGGELSRITFASADFGLHQAIYADGGGAYIDQSARVVDRWVTVWERPELWLFDLHHYLMAGETGEIVTGVLGLMLVFFAISGAILWWRTRKSFRLRLVPRRMTRSAIVRHHRDLGIVALPMLLLSALTGSLMIFPPLSQFLLSPFGEAAPPAAEHVVEASERRDPDWRALVEASMAAFPGALPRRLQIPSKPAAPWLVRLKQDFEWTPNGRTYVYLDPGTSAVVGTVDPAAGDAAQAIQEKFYPLHAGKVGGTLWKLALSLGGISLFLLGTFATWSFWFAPSGKPLGREGQNEALSAVAGLQKSV